MKIFALILLCALPAFSQDAPLERFSVPGFSAGVVTRYSPILIPDNSVQWAKNVYFDEQGVSRRKGYSQFNSTVFTNAKSTRGLWPYTASDGTRYLVALSSQTIYKSGTDGVFSAIAGLSSLSAISDMDAISYLGKIWFANGTDSMAYWDGTSTKTVTEGPLGSMIEGWRNRIVTAGIAGSLSYVYMSKELDGEEWTTGPTTSVDPVAIAFGGTNAKPIRCVYGGFKDFLMVANEDETYGVYGFGRNDFVVRTISREVGCIEDRSVQEKDGALYWMSRRGIEKMTTQGGITRISDGVKDIFDTLIDNTAVNRLKLYSTQSEWQEGNLTASGPGAPISATISPGSIVPSTWSHTDTDGADWNSGTLSNISTSVVPGSISLDIDYTNNATLVDDFSSGIISSSIWTTISNNGFGACTYSSGQMKCARPSSGQGMYTVNTNAFGVWIATVTLSATQGTQIDIVSLSTYQRTIGYGIFFLTNTSLTLQSYGGGSGNICNGSFSATTTPAKLLVTRTRAGLFSVYFKDNLICTGTDTTFSSSSYMSVANISGGSENVFFDNIFKPGYSTTGTFTSQTFDTSFSTPIGGPFSFSDTVPVGSTIAYSVRDSSTSILPTWSDWTLVSTTTSGQYRIPLTKEYWQYKADFSTSYSTQTPVLNEVSLQAVTTGQYIHECAELSGISSFGNFQANSVLSGSGAISYYVSTGAACADVQAATAPWTAQSNNAPIAVSTAAYLGVKEIFDIATSTDTAILRDVTINWLEGTARPPVASAIYKERYYLAYTTTSAINDFMFVSDKNDAPTFFNDINCYSMALFNRNMYCGDANATGKIYQLETGESDNGNAFTSEIRTKAYSFGDPDAEKEFVKMYAAFAPESESMLDINITPSYHLDLSTTAITLNPVNTGEDSTAGMLVSKIPFAMSNNLTGRFLDVTFSNTSATSGWTMFGLNFYFKRYDVK